MRSHSQRQECEVCHTEYRWQQCKCRTPTMKIEALPNVSTDSDLVIRNEILYPLHLYIEHQLIDAR